MTCIFNNLHTIHACNFNDLEKRPSPRISRKFDQETKSGFDLVLRELHACFQMFTPHRHHLLDLLIPACEASSQWGQHPFSTCFELLKFQPDLKSKINFGLPTNAPARRVLTFSGSPSRATRATSSSLSSALRSLHTRPRRTRAFGRLLTCNFSRHCRRHNRTWSCARRCSRFSSDVHRSSQ